MKGFELYKKILQKTLITLGVAMMFTPLLVVAQGGTISSTTPEAQPGYLIVCDGADPNSENPCGYSDLWLLVNRGVNLLIFVAFIVSTFIFLYAGFLYLSSGGDTSKTSKAKQMIKFSVYGLLIILVAWIAVNTILSFFGLKPEYNKVQEVEVSV